MVALLVVWELLSLWVDPVFIASPVDTAKALGRLAADGTLWIQLLITLKRLVIGLAIGAGLGWIVGMLAGLEPRLRSFLEPLRWVGMTVPAVIIAVLAMLWFGLGDFTVIFVVAVIVAPSMYVNTVAGVLALDPRLVELGQRLPLPAPAAAHRDLPARHRVAGAGRSDPGHGRGGAGGHPGRGPGGDERHRPRLRPGQEQPGDARALRLDRAAARPHGAARVRPLAPAPEAGAALAEGGRSDHPART